MLSFARWFTAILIAVVLAARSAAVGTISPARAGASAFAPAPIAHSSHSAVASSISVVKHARTAWQSDTPLTASAIVPCTTCSLGDDELARVPAEPRDLRVVITHDATGPPLSLLT